jgi:hypothetical protein
VYSHLEYITAIWYILGPFDKFGIFSPILVYGVKKIWQTCAGQGTTFQVEELSAPSKGWKCCLRTPLPGLPDVIFSDQKIAIWVKFRGPCNGRC